MKPGGFLLVTGTCLQYSDLYSLHRPQSNDAPQALVDAWVQGQLPANARLQPVGAGLGANPVYWAGEQVL